MRAPCGVAMRLAGQISQLVYDMGLHYQAKEARTVMWLSYGILGSLLAVTVSLLGLSIRSRRRKRNIDVGSVSEAWLAEHRGKTSD
jgi:hypothetical protein